LQRTGRLSLPVKTFKQVRVVGKTGGYGFQSHRAVDDGISSPVHDAEGTAA